MTSLFLWSLLYWTIALGDVSSWSLQTSSLYSISKFTCTYYYCANNWMTQKTISVANYITCTTPPYSIIYLDGTANKKFALYQFSAVSYPRAYYLLSIDFFFMGKWQNEQVSMEIRSGSYVYWSTSFTYTNSTYTMHDFCDTKEYDMQRHYYQIDPNVNGDLFINITSAQGQLSFRNVFISYLKCHFSCKTCTGDKETECLTCFNGLPINSNGTCSSCPNNKPYIYLQGSCQNFCDSNYRPNAYNVCSSISESQYTYNYFQSGSTTFTNLMRYWDQTYDPKHIDDSSKQNYCNYYFYGPFTTRAGAFRTLTFYSGRVYPARIIADLIILGTLNLYSGIHFKFNNIYYGSLFMGQSGYEGHNLIITQESIYSQTCLTYPQFTKISIQLFAPITPSGNGLISVVGNLTNPNTEAWGLYQLHVYGGQLPSYCLKTNTFSECLECTGSYSFLYRGSCYYFSTSTSYTCPSGSYKTTNKCIFYDEESKYAKFYLQAYNSQTPFSDMDTLFDLVNQTGTNFLLGPTNFTSYSLGTHYYRIFGGNLIWSQAAFTKTYTISEAHFAVAVRFTVVFGWNFTDGEFRYDIENQGQKNVSLSNCTGTFDLLNNNSMVSYYQVYEKFDHNISTLSVTVNCVGSNNSVYDAFCAIMEYYIVVSYCQPFCDECTDDVTCLTWNSTYDSTLIVYDASTCLSNQYFDPLQYKCFDCHEYCPTCLTKTTCTSCIDTLQLNALECGCGVQQYMNTVSTPHICVDCTLPCITCISDTDCTDCSAEAHRILIENKCVCIDGYYDDGVDCQKCNLYCTTCTGPTNGECNSCLEITNFILNGHLCECDQHFFFFLNECQACHETCLTCYGSSSNQCLSCDSSGNRIIKGNQCVCEVGFMQSSTVPANCSSCPLAENSSYTECYKTCGDGSSIWHNSNCPSVSCSSEYTNVNNQCIPICGDNLVVGYEECDDGNSVQEDGCFNCAFQCPSQCLTCDASTVIPCEDNCGDGIISGVEQCDDMNDEMYDGCYNCQFQCQPQCTQCIQGSCYECATYGWKVNASDLTCIENCGDYIVVNREQCDDGNDADLDDGCEQCRYRCRSDCLQCNETGNLCVLCNEGFSTLNYYCRNICGDGLVVNSAFDTEECDDGNTTSYDGCSSSCKWQCQSTSICTTCSSNKCQVCVTGYLLKTAENRCDPICGDSLLVANEACDDSNNLLYDSCYKCQYQCDINCTTCNLGQCTGCKSGYHLNLFNRRCEPICNDNIIVAGEECDDNNSIPFDGCYNCQYSCPLFCQLCTKGKCYQCQDGFVLRTGKCQPICGNNQLQISEQCDNRDWNCQNCQLKCQRECISCQSGICAQCQDGYILNQNKCESIAIIQKQIENCVFQIKEECRECAQYYILEYNECKFNFKCSVTNSESCSINNDDVQCLQNYSFNSIINQCVFIETNYEQQCEQYDICSECVKGHCIICKEGWEIDELTNLCVEIKNDNQEVGSEVCDQDIHAYQYQWLVNPQFHYRCLPCQAICESCFYGRCIICQEGYTLNYYNQQCESNSASLFQQCEQGCLFCKNNECLLCNIGFYLNINNQCSSYCGDGLVVGLELFDYGNQEFPYQLDEERCRECPQNCDLCFLGICQQCEYGYIMNTFNNKCTSECGNGIITQNEECDGESNCINCRYACQQVCLQCNQGKCELCSDGWVLEESNSECILIKSTNFEIPDCISFDPQNNCIACIKGFYLDNNRCYSKCGDGIKTYDEECEIQDESCFYCQKQCEYSCQICFQGQCYQCLEGYTLQDNKCIEIQNDGLIVGNEICDDNGYTIIHYFTQLANLNYSFEFCKKCNNNCLTCIDGNCQMCQEGYNLSPFDYQCYLQSENIQVIDNCLLYDQLQKLCLFCQDGWQLSIQGTCIQNVQYSIEMYQSQQSNNDWECQSSCVDCYYDQCLLCQSGWVLDEISQTCYTICGDGLRGGLEFCDDGNDLPYDGCYQCDYQCQLECLDCKEGKCQECTDSMILVPSLSECQILTECENGFYLDSFDNQCKTQCGDKIVAGLEECDDGNNVQYDGCYECEYQCHQKCSQCMLGICHLCWPGYKLDDQKCVPDCGDGIQLSVEECDDGNNIPRDGCTQCKIDPDYQCQLEEKKLSICWKCSQNCQECNQKECLQCASGHFIMDGRCVSCADKCEECENTPNNCTKCFLDGCKTCESRAGYYSDPNDKSVCTELCGDGQVTENEQCDDGNDKDNDGCTQKCTLQKGFICDDNGCQELPEPVLVAEYVNSTTTNDIGLTTQDLKSCEKLLIWIEEFKDDEFESHVTTIDNKCHITFDFYKTIDFPNLIHIKVPIKYSRLLEDEDEDTREIVITPRKKVYYSQSQIEQAKSVVAASQTMSLILQLVGPLTILLGGFEFFWTILDILTWINNFYFMNIEYPENVKLFFQQLEWGDIIMIPNIITLNDESDEYYFEGPVKFTEKEIDPLFANNIQLFVGLMAGSVALYLICKGFTNLIKTLYTDKNKLHATSANIYSLYQNQSIVLKKKELSKKIPGFLKSLNEKCSNYLNNYISFVMQILGLVFLDLCLASVLQLTNTQTDFHWMVQINIVASYLNIGFILYIFFISFKVTSSHTELLKNEKFSCYYGTLIDDINVESNVAKTYSFINLIRKSLFIFFTVYFYYNPLIQTSTCCLAAFVNIALLVFENPFENYKVLIKNGFPDFCIFIILLMTVILAVDDQNAMFSVETRFFMGWVILSFIGLSIGTQLVFLMNQFVRELYSRYLWIKSYFIKQKSEQKKV